jgi:ComF family protein
MRAFADLLAPLGCVACGAACGEDLCERCADQVAPLGSPICARCGGPAGASPGCCADLVGFDRARSLVTYSPPSSRLALALKRRGRGGLAAAMGELLAALARRERLDAAGLVVTAVPAGAAARRRGYDHAELLGRAVARSLGRPWQPLLVRRCEGPRQADVPLTHRRHNVRARFAARPTGEQVMIVDDVFTTGATAEACAVALRDAGAPRVDMLTWARTLRRTRKAG